MRVLCRKQHTGLDEVGVSVSVPVGVTGVLLNDDQSRAMSPIHALVKDLKGESPYRFIAWDIPNLENNVTIVRYVVPEMRPFVVGLMPLAKDMVSVAIAGDCRQELANLYEAYHKMEIDGGQSDRTEHEFKASFESKLQLLMKSVEAAIRDRVGF